MHRKKEVKFLISTLQLERQIRITLAIRTMTLTFDLKMLKNNVLYAKHSNQKTPIYYDNKKLFDITTDIYVIHTCWNRGDRI